MCIPALARAGTHATRARARARAHTHTHTQVWMYAGSGGGHQIFIEDLSLTAVVEVPAEWPGLAIRRSRAAGGARGCIMEGAENVTHSGASFDHERASDRYATHAYLARVALCASAQRAPRIVEGAETCSVL